VQQGRTTWSAAVRQGAGTGAARSFEALLALRRLLLAERHRWALWAPVLMGLGVLLYMAPPDDPPGGWTGIALLVLAATALAALRALYARQTALATLACLLAALPAGYLIAVWRTAQVDTISLARPLTLEVAGRIIAVEGRARGHRLTLDQVAVLDRELAAVPQRIRIGVAKGAELLAAGDRIRVRARLEAPQPPALPGSYDWARPSS
jgi:competence protein ComEC